MSSHRLHHQQAQPPQDITCHTASIKDRNGRAFAAFFQTQITSGLAVPHFVLTYRDAAKLQQSQQVPNMASLDENNAHIKVEPTDDEVTIMSIPQGNPFNPHQFHAYGDENEYSEYSQHLPVYNFGHNATLAPGMFQDAFHFSVPNGVQTPQGNWVASSVETANVYGGMPAYYAASNVSVTFAGQPTLNPQAVHLSPLTTAALFPEIDMSDLESPGGWSTAASLGFSADTYSPYSTVSPAPTDAFVGGLRSVQAPGPLGTVHAPAAVTPAESPAAMPEDYGTPSSAAESASDYASPVSMHISDERLHALRPRHKKRGRQQRTQGASRRTAQAQASIDLLVKLKNKGWQYGDMKNTFPDMFPQPLATMRTQYRNHILAPAQRPRVAFWHDIDIALLRQGVARHYSEGAYGVTKRDVPPWAKVTEWMAANGASRQFAAATASKKWQEIRVSSRL